MNRNEIRRRDVLASVGGSVVTLSAGVEATKLNSRTRLVEASLTFDFPDGEYLTTNIHGNPIYTLDEKSNRVALYPTDSDQRHRLVNADSVVAATTVVTPPTTVGPHGETAVVTETIGTRRPARTVHLDSPVRVAEPSVTITGGRTVVTVGSDRARLRPGETIERTLDDVTVTPVKRYRSTERPEIEGVPDHRIGHTTETEPVAVTATPTLRVADRGELEVVQLTD